MRAADHEERLFATFRREGGYFIPDMLFTGLQLSGSSDIEDTLKRPELAHEVAHSIQISCTPFGQTLGSYYAIVVHRIIDWFKRRENASESAQSIPFRLPLLKWAEDEECPSDLRERIRDIRLLDNVLGLFYGSVVKPWKEKSPPGPLHLWADPHRNLVPLFVRKQKNVNHWFATGIGLQAILDGWASVIEAHHLPEPDRAEFWESLARDEKYLYTATRDLVCEALGSYYDDTLAILSDFSLLTRATRMEIQSKKFVPKWFPGYRFVRALESARKIGPFEEFRPKENIDNRYKGYYHAIRRECGWDPLDVMLERWSSLAQKMTLDPPATLGIDWGQLGLTGAKIRTEHPSAVAFMWANWRLIPKIFWPAFWADRRQTSFWIKPGLTTAFRRRSRNDLRDGRIIWQFLHRVYVEEWFIIRQMLQRETVECTPQLLDLHCPFSKSCEAKYPWGALPRRPCEFSAVLAFWDLGMEPITSWWPRTRKNSITNQFETKEAFRAALKGHLVALAPAEAELAEQLVTELESEFVECTVGSVGSKSLEYTYRIRVNDINLLDDLLEAVRADASIDFFGFSPEAAKTSLVGAMARTVATTFKVIRCASKRGVKLDHISHRILLGLSGSPQGVSVEELCNWLNSCESHNVNQWRPEKVREKLFNFRRVEFQDGTFASLVAKDSHGRWFSPSARPKQTEMA